MIEPLRRSHFRIWIALAIGLPLLLAASLLVRQPARPNPQGVFLGILR